jgi:hypothetical protein
MTVGRFAATDFRPMQSSLECGSVGMSPVEWLNLVCFDRRSGVFLLSRWSNLVPRFEVGFESAWQLECQMGKLAIGEAPLGEAPLVVLRRIWS